MKKRLASLAFEFQKVPCLSLRAFLTVQVLSFLELFVNWSQNMWDMDGNSMG